MIISKTRCCCTGAIRGERIIRAVGLAVLQTRGNKSAGWMHASPLSRSDLHLRRGSVLYRETVFIHFESARLLFDRKFHLIKVYFEKSAKFNWQISSFLESLNNLFVLFFFFSQFIIQFLQCGGLVKFITFLFVCFFYIQIHAFEIMLKKINIKNNKLIYFSKNHN